MPAAKMAPDASSSSRERAPRRGFERWEIPTACGCLSAAGGPSSLFPASSARDHRIETRSGAVSPSEREANMDQVAEEDVDPSLSPPLSQGTFKEMWTSQIVEPFWVNESKMMASTQQASIPFPAEGNSSMDQTNFGLLAPAASSPLAPLAESYPVGEDLSIIQGLAEFLGDPQFLLHPPKDYGTGESCVFPPTEDYPGQFGFNLEFEQSGTAKSVTYTVRSGTGEIACCRS